MEATLRALADESRRTVVETLSRGPATAGELAALLPIARPGVSRHLRVLREAGLVEVRQEAQRLSAAASLLRAGKSQMDSIVAQFQHVGQRDDPPPFDRPRAQGADGRGHGDRAPSRPRARSVPGTGVLNTSGCRS